MKMSGTVPNLEVSQHPSWQRDKALFFRESSPDFFLEDLNGFDWFILLDASCMFQVYVLGFFAPQRPQPNVFSPSHSLVRWVVEEMSILSGRSGRMLGSVLRP